MSTFADRPHRALLVIDVQTGVVQYAFERDRVVGNVRTLVDEARRAGLPVIWVQHNDAELPIGSDDWQLAAGLEPLPDEARVDKQYRSSFEATDLEEVLAGHGIGSLVVCGAETNFCIRHTLHAALERGYDVTLVADAHTALDSTWEDPPIPAELVIEELNRSYRDYQLPGRRCDVASTATALAPPAAP
jgi:nicotinamidase-related amidase